MATREVRESVSSCGEDLEKVLGPGLLPELGKIKMRDSFEKQYRMILVLTVADDRRVRNLAMGIHVVVDYVSLNGFY